MGKLTFKDYFILVLSGLLVSVLIFRNVGLSTHNETKEKIKSLQEQNQILSNKNDSLKSINKKIDDRIKELDGIIEHKNAEIMSQTKQISILKNKKNEIRNNVNTLDANGVASGISNYIETKSNRSNR